MNTRHMYVHAYTYVMFRDRYGEKGKKNYLYLEFLFNCGRDTAICLIIAGVK